MSDHDRKIKPTRTKGDLAHAATKGALGAIPFVGALATEFFGSILQAPYQKRMVEFIESIADGLEQLRNEVAGLKKDQLSTNELFITTAQHAVRIAGISHQEEKRAALRNVVLNSALPNAPDEDLQAMFLNLVDGFTPKHLNILNFFGNPYAIVDQTAYPPNKGVVPTKLLEDSIQAVKDYADFYEQILNDLATRGLINRNALNRTIPLGDIPKVCLTTLGRQFLEFIQSPISS